MRDLFQVVFELKQKEIDDALRKMDKDKRVINSYKQLPYTSVSPTKASKNHILDHHILSIFWKAKILCVLSLEIFLIFYNAWIHFALG